MKKCFDAEKYLKLQKAKIFERVKMFDKLYLEFGGKLIDDKHAARVLPGFLPDLKIRLLEEFREQAEVILCISAIALEAEKTRADNEMGYGDELIRLMEFLRGRGLLVRSVVITLFDGQKKAVEFGEKLKKYDVFVHFHKFTKGYPEDVAKIVSEEGYGANSFIETTKPLVIVSAPGASSGKMATCLSQVYHENKRGVRAGYAKFETFPVWNLGLDHPVNLAYEAATADIEDFNMIDPFHLEKYGVEAVNYNRDVATFPLLQEIFRRTLGEEIYFSPTDMGVNMVGECIFDDEAVREAARAEVFRRFDGAESEKEQAAIREIIGRL